MSRIGRLPVNLPAGVTVTVSPDNVVSVKGPLGTLSQKVDSDIKVEVGTHTDVHTQKEIPAVLVSRPTNQPRHRSLHGLYRHIRDSDRAAWNVYFNRKSAIFARAVCCHSMIIPALDAGSISIVVHRDSFACFVLDIRYDKKRLRDKKINRNA